MKKHIKIFFMTIMLAGIMFILSGCAYYDSDFSFEFHDEYMADKYVDLLIPLDETDERYTDFNCNIKGGDYQAIEIPENSEIVNYNENGFRSMLMHMKDARLNVYIYEKFDYEIRQCINLPDEWYEWSYEHGDCYGTEAFLEFCNKYRKCRVAVFDKDGNIIKVSKKIPLVSAGNFYIDDTTFYDVENDILKPNYVAPPEIAIFIVVVWLFLQISIIGSVITLIVYKINHNQWDRTYKKYIIASSLFNVPTVLLIIIGIYTSFGTSLTIKDFFINLFSRLINIYSIGILITISVLVFFIVIEKCLKKRQQKNILDIS